MYFPILLKGGLKIRRLKNNISHICKNIIPKSGFIRRNLKNRFEFYSEFAPMSSSVPEPVFYKFYTGNCILFFRIFANKWQFPESKNYNRSGCRFLFRFPISIFCNVLRNNRPGRYISRLFRFLLPPSLLRAYIFPVSSGFLHFFSFHYVCFGYLLRPVLSTFVFAE